MSGKPNLTKVSEQAVSLRTIPNVRRLRCLFEKAQSQLLDAQSDDKSTFDRPTLKLPFPVRDFYRSKDVF